MSVERWNDLTQKSEILRFGCWVWERLTAIPYAPQPACPFLLLEPELPTE